MFLLNAAGMQNGNITVKVLFKKQLSQELQPWEYIYFLSGKKGINKAVLKILTFSFYRKEIQKHLNFQVLFVWGQTSFSSCCNLGFNYTNFAVPYCIGDRPTNFWGFNYFVDDNFLSGNSIRVLSQE